MRNDSLEIFPGTDEVHEHGRTRYLRTANFLLAMTEIRGGLVLERDNPDEYMLVVPPGLKAEVDAGGRRALGDGDDLFIVPPGHSRIIVRGHGCLARIFSNRAVDLLEMACNQADYVDGAGEVAKLVPWPVPEGGFRLRHYPLAQYVDGTLPGRCFRSSNLMLNITDVYPGQRDSRCLKPHSHKDFEQITLTYAGRFVHHLRTPWDVDSTRWVEDRHLNVGSPAALTIPAGLIHTSQAMEQGCWLVDVFGPPRMDFSLMPGFVRNAAEYPLPE